MWRWVISPFYDFCCFRYVSHCMSPLTSVQTDVLYIYHCSLIDRLEHCLWQGRCWVPISFLMGFPTSASWLSLLLLACTGSKIWGLQTVWLVRNWLIWRSVPSVLKCSPTLEFCRVTTRSVSSVCWSTATTNNRETACRVHCAGKSSPFQTTGYRERRRTSSWRNCFITESF